VGYKCIDVKAVDAKQGGGVRRESVFLKWKDWCKFWRPHRHGKWTNERVL